MWEIDTITATVTGKSKGEVSVKLVDEEGDSLLLNKIMVDLSDGAEPVSIFRFQGTPIISGTFVDGLKDGILSIFQDDLSDKGVGVYKISDKGIQKL